MQVFNYGGNSGVFLDRCPDKHGLWLDPDELENIQIAMEGPPPEVSRELGAHPEADEGADRRLTPPRKLRRCPACDASLDEAELGDIPLDLCGQCGGVWCDGNELTTLFFTWQEASGGAQAPAGENVPRSEDEDLADRERLCVICQAPLERFNFHYTSDVYVDNCPRGHGTWLDADRIEQLRAYARGLVEAGDAGDDSRTRSLSEGELRRGRRGAAPRCGGAFTTFLQLFGLCTES